MTRLKGSILVILFLFLHVSCNFYEKKTEVEGETILINEDAVAEKDADQEALIIEYRDSLEADMNRLLVYSEMVMERGTPEGKLNNFVADLVFNIGERLYEPEDSKPIDFCLLNYGGLRVPLPQGEITYARVFELLPFENEMVVITLSGDKTMELFEYLAESSVGMPVSGINLTIADNQPVSISIQGEEFDPDKTYKVLTSDYLAGGGDHMNFFLQPINYELLGMRVRDAIIQHMQEVHARGGKITSKLDNRISVDDE